MANQHAVSVTALTIPSTAEIVVATMTPFTENQQASAAGLGLGTPSAGGQGVVLDGNMNVAPSSAGTITVRVRYGSLTGALIAGLPAAGLITTLAITVAQSVPIFVLDPTLIQAGVVYVFTAQLAAGTATVNYGVFTAQDANSFE
jgi:hypothetical protein